MIKRYYSPKPDRLLVNATVADAAKQAVLQIRATADPALLPDELRTAQDALRHWMDRRGFSDRSAGDGRHFQFGFSGSTPKWRAADHPPSALSSPQADP